MPTKRPYARIAITLPAEDLAAADRVAAKQDRSRSWVIAEAIRAYTAVAPEVSARPVAGLGPSRLAQLAADLRLSPIERVRAAEETARAIPRPRGGRVQRVIAFDRFEDFLEWKQRDAIGP